MRCKNCNIEITENEIFCDECKKEMKKISSKNDVKELEKLIENQNRLNDLEDTKELDDLEKLVIDELKEEQVENTNVIEISDDKEKLQETKPTTREQKNKKKSKKKLIIIVIFVFVLIISLLVAILLLNKEDKKDKEEQKISIDYEKVINEYGKSIEEIVQNYIIENSEVPTWQHLVDLTAYDKHEVVCEIHDIYSDGSIYLNSCKVDNEKTKYSYGEEKEEIKEGKKIDIYKLSYENSFNNYYSYNESGSSLVGSITCKTEECNFITAYSKYVVIKEENQYYLYNYETNTMEFGPFDVPNEYALNSNILVHNDTVYGILYNQDGSNNIYNVKTGKTLKNISGTLVLSQLSFDPSIMYKYNSVPMGFNGKVNFVNLKTGNISFSITESISTFIEDTINNIVYILVHTESYNKFKIYNSNGKLLFDGKEYSKIKLINGDLMVATDSEFEVYDSNLKLKVSNKDYDKVLEIYDEYIVVVDKGDIKILNLVGDTLTTFENSYNKNSTFDSLMSGINEENNKIVLNICIENVGEATIKYSYIPSTNETEIEEITLY